MIFSNEDKIIVQNYYEEKNCRLLLEAAYDCFSRRKHGFDRTVGLLTGRAAPYAFSTKKNCRTNKNQSIINTENDEKRNLKQFKRLKTPEMSEETRNRRETRAGSLRKRFEINIRLIEKTVSQDEKISLLKFLSICRTFVYMVKKRNQISLMKIYLVWQTRCPKKSWHPLRFHGMV